MSPNNGTSRSSSTTFHFTAGLGSGILSAVLLQPADLLKTRVQQSHSTSLVQIVREIARGPQPLRQFWRGTLPSTLRTGVGSALYFSSLNSLRQYVARSSLLAQSGLVVPSTSATTTANLGVASNQKHSSALPKLSNIANLTTGAVARASVGFVMMPITVIKVRYESNYYAYRSLWHASSDILGKEGVRGLFAGFGATAVRDAPYAGLYVVFYEQAKKRLSALVERAPVAVTSVDASATAGTMNKKGSDMKGSTSASINFVSGVLAAGLATALTNPFDAVKTRIQLLPAEYGNMVQAARLMVKKDGFVSLLDGLGLRMARKAMSSALAWTLYEELIRRAEKRWEKKEDVL